VPSWPEKILRNCHQLSISEPRRAVYSSMACVSILLFRSKDRAFSLSHRLQMALKIAHRESMRAPYGTWWPSVWILRVQRAQRANSVPAFRQIRTSAVGGF